MSNPAQQRNFAMSQIRVRVLNPQFDQKHYAAAWEWRKGKPEWFTESMKTWGMTKEIFFEQAKQDTQTDFAIFRNNKVRALVTVEEIAPSVLQVHFDCEKNPNFEELLYAISIIKQHVFKNGVIQVVGWIQSFNAPMLKLYDTVGFVPTNVSVLRGSYKNTPVEWLQFVLTAPQGQKSCQNEGISVN